MNDSSAFFVTATHVQKSSHKKYIVIVGKTWLESSDNQHWQNIYLPAILSETHTDGGRVQQPSHQRIL